MKTVKESAEFVLSEDVHFPIYLTMRMVVGSAVHSVAAPFLYYTVRESIENAVQSTAETPIHEAVKLDVGHSNHSIVRPRDGGPITGGRE